MPINYVEVEVSKLKGRKKFPLWMKISVGLLAFFIFSTAVLTLYFYPRVKVLAQDAEIISSNTQLLKKSIEKQDVTKAKHIVLKIRSDLKKTKKDIKNIGILAYIPVV